MSWLRVLACGIPALFVKQGPESNLDDELRPHIEMLTEENHGEGMSSEEARYTARRVLSGIEQTKEIHPERRGVPIVETVVRDVRYALRAPLVIPGHNAHLFGYVSPRSVVIAVDQVVVTVGVVMRIEHVGPDPDIHVGVDLA